MTERSSARRGTTRSRALTGSVLALTILAGCTRESVRVALEVQQRANEIQQTVCERQHEALCVLLYRDALRKLADQGAELTPPQRAALSAAWNDRDLLEFWLVQHERARALRLVGVDAKLAGDQSILDLLMKDVAAHADRAAQGLAGWAGAAMTTRVLAPELGDESGSSAELGQ